MPARDRRLAWARMRYPGAMAQAAKMVKNSTQFSRER
jgi:hypothetical protein